MSQDLVVISHGEAPTRLATETFGKGDLTMHQLAWDSTSLGEFKMCPRRYYYRVLLAKAPRGQSAHLTFGLIYHSALELYDHRKAVGDTHEQAVEAAVYHALDATWDYENGRPWASDNNLKDRDSLLRTIIWYLAQFEDDPCETLILDNGKPAVELSFRFGLGVTSSLTGSEYMLCGHLDRVVRFNYFNWVLDRKTTKYALDDNYGAKYNPDNQMSLYQVAGRLILEEPIKGIIIDAAQVQVSQSRFRRYRLERHESLSEEWLDHTSVWLQLAERYVEMNMWPMNDKACLMYYSANDPIHSGCPYRGLCSAAPKMREAYLRSLFNDSPWDPLMVRGDI